VLDDFDRQAVDLADRIRSEHLCGRAFSDDPAVVHQQDSIGET
jgi:hypothetical protein